jgi:choline transport protein
MASILSNISVGMYGVYHPDYVSERWHVFVGYLIATWLCCGIVLFFNRALPMINNIGLFFILGGVFVTIIVCTVMVSGIPKVQTPQH